MITITQGFTGYPGGKPRRFSAGDTPQDLSAEYEALLVSKGHAVRPIPEAIAKRSVPTAETKQAARSSRSPPDRPSTLKDYP